MLCEGCQGLECRHALLRTIPSLSKPPHTTTQLRSPSFAQVLPDASARAPSVIVLATEIKALATKSGSSLYLPERLVSGRTNALSSPQVQEAWVELCRVALHQAGDDLVA